MNQSWQQKDEKDKSDVLFWNLQSSKQAFN